MGGFYLFIYRCKSIEFLEFLLSGCERLILCIEKCYEVFCYWLGWGFFYLKIFKWVIGNWFLLVFLVVVVFFFGFFKWILFFFILFF